MGLSEIMTVKEVADFLRTTTQQVRRMIAIGELPAVKVGREWRIPLAALKAYFRENI
ncbi:MAG: helix-turn-helix domain-containing protein [Agathobaculum butyriciproducens]|nr:helix-turn-helix domain-containing protein [Agathobaculum butyriciproducens]